MLLPAQKYVLSTPPTDRPLSLADFSIVEDPVEDDLGPGELLVSALYLSTDPNLRAGGLEGKPMPQINSNGDIPGSQVGRITKSTHPTFPINSLIYGFFGWRTLTRVKIDANEGWRGIYKLPDYFDNQLPISYALGVLGMPGITAHCAVEKILGIKDGGVLVVSTATGAVGNLVLQIGKMRGCKTLVFTSTDEKVIWLKTLGAGYIFNYNKVDPDAVFRDFAPEGIDFYFDNIGGAFTHTVMRRMRPCGRIAVCDAISCYSETNTINVPFDYLNLIDKRIRVEGFSVLEGYAEEDWKDGMDDLVGWIRQGKIKVEETILDGFDKMAQAFISRYEGLVVGVQVVKV